MILHHSRLFLPSLAVIAALSLVAANAQAKAPAKTKPAPAWVTSVGVVTVTRDVKNMTKTVTIVRDDGSAVPLVMNGIAKELAAVHEGERVEVAGPEIHRLIASKKGKTSVVLVNAKVFEPIDDSEPDEADD